VQTTETIRRSLDAAEDLQSIVKTMKALAAIGIRQYEDAARSLSEYDRTVRLGLQAVLRGVNAPGSHPPPRGGRRDATTSREIVVALGSDQGMCGQLNDSVVRRIEERFGDADPPPVILASGARLTGIVTDAVTAPERRYRTPESMERVASAAGRILREIQQRREDDPDLAVHLVFPRRTSAAGYDVRWRRILPLDQRWLDALREEPWPTRCIPAWPGPRLTVLRSFIGEYLFVSMCRALVDTLASEHASRLSSMQSAERNIADRLEELNDRYRRRRQEKITSELMDVVSGFEALGEGDRA